MLNKLIALSSSLIPTGLAAKGLGKIDKRLQNFFIGAGVAGYGADAAIDFLRNQFSNQAQDSDTQRLQNRSASGQARPDEMAALKSAQRNEQVPNMVKGVLSGTAGLAGGLGGADSSNSPVSPENQQQKPQSPLGREVLEEQSGDMFDPSDALKAFEQLVSQGESPDRAAAKMSSLPKFRSIIPRIEQESGMKFADWAIQNLERMQGGRQNGRQEQNGQNQGQKQNFLAELGKMNQMLQGLKR